MLRDVFSQGKSREQLVLGTAQLGMNYGVANRTGKPEWNQAVEIVHSGWESGICEFDTAQGYGNSEEILGHALKEIGESENLRIITKPDPRLNHLDKKSMSDTLERSLKNLNLPRIHGYLLHKEMFLSQWSKGLGEILTAFVKENLVDRIGISVYRPESAREALETEGIDMVQLPMNFLDKRFFRKNIFELAGRLGKTIYIRSVFLQGVLLMPEKQLPPYLGRFRPLAAQIESFCNRYQIGKDILALGYIRKTCPEAKVIFGAETPAQIHRNIQCWETDIPEEILRAAENEFDVTDEDLLNPARWPHS